MFSAYGFRLKIFRPFGREVLLIILRSPFITLPAGLYMNGELAQY